LPGGWRLLTSVVGLLLHPHLSPDHFVALGAGTLAILQNLIKPRQREADTTVILVNETSEPDDGLSPLDTNVGSEVKALG
jgi:hypothetical protein